MPQCNGGPRAGPFRDADRQHDAYDWFECRGKIVPDDSLGEAAFRKALRLECDIVGFMSSDWTISPLNVRWEREDGWFEDLRFLNSWKEADLRERLRYEAPPISFWGRLEEMSECHFVNLSFGPKCYDPLRGLPFYNIVATRIHALLDILDQLAVSFEPEGRRSANGLRMYQEYLTGDGRMFSDSSDTEKRRFGMALQFRHPDKPDGAIPCTWHAKVCPMPLRIHFSWPVRTNDPLYVMYIGQKITRR